MGRSTKEFDEWWKSVAEQTCSAILKKAKMTAESLYLGGANIETAVNTLLREASKEG